LQPITISAIHILGQGFELDFAAPAGMPSAARRLQRPPQVPAFEDLTSDIQEFSDDGGAIDDLVDQDEVEEVDADVEEDELGLFTRFLEPDQKPSPRSPSPHFPTPFSLV
jgi:hypothetical protein